MQYEIFIQFHRCVYRVIESFECCDLHNTHTHRHRKCIHLKFNSIFQTSDLHARVIQSAIYYHRVYTAVFILLFRIGSKIHALFAIMLVFSRFCDAYNKIDDFNASKQKKRKDVMHLAEIVWFCVRAKKSDFPSHFAFKKKKKLWNMTIAFIDILWPNMTFHRNAFVVNGFDVFSR